MEDPAATLRRDVEAEVVALRRFVENATASLGRNLAGVGADLQTAQAELRATRGVIASLQATVEKDREDRSRRLAALEARLDALEADAAQPRTPSQLWDAGKAAFQASRWSDARSAFARLVEMFPGHERADDALYFRAETYLREQQWEIAIREYRAVFDRFPESALADDALFRAAHCAEQLKQCSEARTYLGLLRQRYERSELAKQAAIKDKALRRSAGARCRS